MLLQAEEAAQHEAAAEHRQHYLLYSCSRAFKDNVTQARLQQIRKKLAQQLRDTTVRLSWPQPQTGLCCMGSSGWPQAHCIVWAGLEFTVLLSPEITGVLCTVLDFL